ncbi:MAG: zinc-ribbon domain-containing protein [Actinobacteria bacterium]|nr:MAG: zinc-ribbon domain-containing protein [Actinomycetota bacterium]
MSVQTCSSCGRENPPEARFCNACASPLPGAAAARPEERKIVTVLFVDLVGFTARSERLDPEDVRAIQTPYFTRVRTAIEAFGGTVEKYIGDAVMAVFGAPVAHGDDPERAVRAALAVLAGVEELNAADSELDLQVRIAVNTGEALVSVSANAAQGETPRRACRPPPRRTGSSSARRRTSRRVPRSTTRTWSRSSPRASRRRCGSGARVRRTRRRANGRAGRSRWSAARRNSTRCATSGPAS